MAKRMRITDPETLVDRRAYARQLIRAGKSRLKIQDALVSRFGIGIGAVWVNDEIRRLKTFKKTKTPALANGHGHDDVEIITPLDTEPVTQQFTAQLDSEMILSLTMHLMHEGKPFTFDGKSLKLT